jgi:predicted esterase
MRRRHARLRAVAQCRALVAVCLAALAQRRALVAVCLAALAPCAVAVCLAALAPCVVACAPARPQAPGATPPGEWAEYADGSAAPPSPAGSRTDAGPASPAPAEASPVLDRVEALLEVPGHRPAIVSFPAGLRRVEPLLMALHGAGDGPEWECAVWRDILGDRGVVLCPTGRPLGRTHGGHYHPNHHELEALVLASLEALEQTYGDRVDTSDVVYAAYSQGATMGVHMIVPHAARFPRLVLVEGGFGQWNVARGLAYRKGGGTRVLFACGTSGCGRSAERSAGYLRRAGLEARTETAPGAGHTYGGAVADRVREALPWVFEGDARWAR